jgi:hypothetical protein
LSATPPMPDGKMGCSLARTAETVPTITRHSTARTQNNSKWRRETMQIPMSLQEKTGAVNNSQLSLDMDESQTTTPLMGSPC